MDYDKFERLLYANECAVRRRLAAPEERIALLAAVRELLAERDALIADNEQAVKGRADMRSALREARAAAPQPASSVALAQVIESGDYEARVQWLLNPLPVGSILYEEAPQPISSAEGSMPLYSVFSELVFMQRIFFIRNSQTGEQYGKFQMRDIAEAECQHMNDVASGQFSRADELPMPMPEPDTSSIAGYSCNALREYGRKREAAGYARALRESGERLRSGREILDKALRGKVKP